MELIGSRSRLLTVGWWSAAVVTFWSFGYTVLRGSDLWWHLATGRRIWERRALPLSDPWSFTRQGERWLQHEWLADLVYEAWSRALGIDALVYWKWSVILTAYLTLMASLRRITSDPLAAYLAALGAVAVGAPFLDIRPHLYSLLGFSLLLLVTLPPAPPPRWLPLLFLVWANLHGVFFFGLLALLIIVSSRAIVERSTDGLTTLLASVAACAINPNGAAAFAYPLKYAFDRSSPFRGLGEWRPPFEPGGIQAPLYPLAVVCFVVAAAIVLRGRLRRDQPVLLYAALGLATLTLAMSLSSRRFIPLFAMAGSVVVALALRMATAPALRRLESSRLSWALPVAGLAFGIVRLAPFPHTTLAFRELTALDAFPIETCNSVDVNKFTGPVFAYYNWGGYLHLRTDGRLQVFIDGRADTVFDAATYESYLRVLRQEPGWMDVVSGSGARYVLWPKGEIPEALVASGRFRPLVADSVSTLLVRSDTPAPARLRPTPESPWRRMALADAAEAAGRPADAEAHLRRALAEAPHLGAACQHLAEVQARAHRLAAALATGQDCQRIFPSRHRAEALEQLVREARREMVPTRR